MTDALSTSIVNLLLLTAGTMLLSSALGWKVGFGIALLAMFLKQPEES
jgi:hypothetical protein